MSELRQGFNAAKFPRQLLASLRRCDGRRERATSSASPLFYLIHSTREVRNSASNVMNGWLAEDRKSSDGVHGTRNAVIVGSDVFGQRLET
jgi:hypothetical protein